jgi:hypothetical protein
MSPGAPSFHVLSDDVVARRLDDVVILINLKTNRIFELNSTGARLWELISAGSSRDEIDRTMLEEFEVSESELSNAIDLLAGWLAAEGLIASRDAN